MPRNALAAPSQNALAEQVYFGNPNITAQGAKARALRGGYATPDQATDVAKTALGFTPIVGDVMSGYDALQALRQGNYGEAALNAVGLLPFVPGMTKVFHGGAVRVLSPDLSKSGSVSKIAEEGRAFWVTPSQESAIGFGKMASKNPVISEFDFLPKNPLVIEYPVKSLFDNTFSQIKIDALNKARKAGHDAVIFKQEGKGAKLLEDEIAVIDPSILKATQP